MAFIKLKQAATCRFYSYHLLLLLELSVAVSCGQTIDEDDLGLAEVIRSKQRPETSHIKESAEFQAINSYLTNLGPLTTNIAVVIPHLNAAIDRFESLSWEDFGEQGSAETDDGEGSSDSFKVLLENDPQISLSIMRNLVSASKSCEQSELNFLVMVTEQQTFKGQFLNKYARSLLEQCWMFNLASLSQRIDRSIGKLSSAVFDFLAELGNQVWNRHVKERQTKNPGTLTISDQSPPNDPATLLQQLKQVNFEPQSQLRTIALALNSMFSNRFAIDDNGNRMKIPKKEEISKLATFYKNSLIAPCELLVDRMKGAFSLLNDYNYPPAGERDFSHLSASASQLEQLVECAQQDALSQVVSLPAGGGEIGPSAQTWLNMAAGQPPAQGGGGGGAILINGDQSIFMSRLCSSARK